MKRIRSWATGAMVLLIGAGAAFQASRAPSVGAMVEVGRYRDGRGRLGRGGLAGSTGSGFYGSPTSVYLTLTDACACAPVTATVNGIVRSIDVTSDPTYCVKGNETSGIQAGDLVLCGANLPRVMPGGSGDGGLGLQVWESRRNGYTRSQDLCHSDWIKSASGVTITCNVKVAPDGTVTADRIQMDGVATDELYQASCPVNYALRSGYYLLPVLADGGTNVRTFGMGQHFANCTARSDGWTRCFDWDQTVTAFGYAALIAAGDAPLDVWGWQFDCQDNTNKATQPMPPPISTGAAAVTRAADILRVNAVIPQRTNLTFSARYLSENGLDAGLSTRATVFELGDHTGTDSNRIQRDDGNLTCDFLSGGTDSPISMAGLTGEAQVVLSCRFDGDAGGTTCIDSYCVDGGLGAAPPVTNELVLGAQWNGFNYIYFANGVVKDLSVAEGATKDIFLFGDSIVEGGGSPQPAAPQNVVHQVLGNRVAINNLAISGHTIEQCNADWTAQLAVVRDAGTAGRTFFMVQCGINSATDGGQVVAQLKSMLLDAKDAGLAQVMWSTVTPDHAIAAQISYINDNMNAWVPGTGVAAAQTYSALVVQDGGDSLDPRWDFGDTVHLNDAGTRRETLLWIQIGDW